MSQAGDTGRKLSVSDSLAGAPNTNSMGVPPTATRRERFAWYMYDFANGAFFWPFLTFLGIFAISQATGYKKHTLCSPKFEAGTPEYNFCYEREWALNYETEGTCVTRSIADKDGYPKGTDEWSATTCTQAGEKWLAKWDPKKSRVALFGVDIGVSAIGQGCGFISVFIQLLLFVFFGGIADYGGMRKTMLIGSTVAGCTWTIVVYASAVNSEYMLTAVCLILSNLFMGFAASVHPVSQQLAALGGAGPHACGSPPRGTGPSSMQQPLATPLLHFSLTLTPGTRYSRLSRVPLPYLRSSSTPHTSRCWSPPTLTWRTPRRPGCPVST